MDLKRAPIETLGRLVEWFKRPDKDRFTYWRTLFAGKRWALVLITSGKPGEPQDPPYKPTRPTADRESLHRPPRCVQRTSAAHRRSTGAARPRLDRYGVLLVRHTVRLDDRGSHPRWRRSRPFKERRAALVEASSR
jgi:hypothetical protein